jgi:NAD+ synthase
MVVGACNENMTLGLGSLLAIDARREAAEIERHIRELLDVNAAEGVVMGLSGGLDSAVVATSAVRALGNKNVCAYYLHDRDSPRDSRAKANLIADWLGIELEHRDITAAMRKMGIYRPLIMRITFFSGFVNRQLNTKLHRLLFREPSFISTLRQGNLKANGIRRFFHERTLGAIEAAFNARHIYRRQFLEQKSKEKNRLVLGAANRSELMVGWFVKGGVDDVPFSPIIGMYKTQVTQLAKYVNLPSRIQNQAPSPDMIRGITDESALGISYGTLDIILYCTERGMSEQEIAAKGISKKDVRLVHAMNNLSAWKRAAC